MGTSNPSASPKEGTAIQVLLKDSYQARTHSEPRVAGQSPKHMLKMGEYALKCPSAHIPTFGYYIPNAYHNPGLICPRSSLVVECPHLSSIPLISALTDHLCRSPRSKLDFGVLHQAAAGKVWWEVYTTVIVFS